MTEQTPPSPQFNPHFLDKIPAMQEELAQAKLAVRESLKSADVVSRQLLDYLLFEVQKARLAITTLEWESKVDPAVMQKAKDHRQQLMNWIEVIQSDSAVSSIDYIDTLSEQLDELRSISS